MTIAKIAATSLTAALVAGLGYVYAQTPDASTAPPANPSTTAAAPSNDMSNGNGTTSPPTSDAKAAPNDSTNSNSDMSNAPAPKADRN